MKIKVTVQQGKKCTRCGQIKPLGLFPIDNGKPDGHREMCHACYSERRKRRRMFLRYSKRGTKTPMMASELFAEVYRNRELRDYIKALARQRGRGNKTLEDDMVEAAWVRISFMQSGKSLDAMKNAAYRAIEAERWKFWAEVYHEGISFAELLTAEEWAMWTHGCGE